MGIGGINSEAGIQLMTDGFTLGYMYVEDGIVKFRDFAKQMIADIGSDLTEDQVVAIYKSVDVVAKKAGYETEELRTSEMEDQLKALKAEAEAQEKAGAQPDVAFEEKYGMPKAEALAAVKKFHRKRSKNRGILAEDAILTAKIAENDAAKEVVGADRAALTKAGAALKRSRTILRKKNKPLFKDEVAVSGAALVNREDYVALAKDLGIAPVIATPTVQDVISSDEESSPAELLRKDILRWDNSGLFADEAGESVLIDGKPVRTLATEEEVDALVQAKAKLAEAEVMEAGVLTLEKRISKLEQGRRAKVAQIAALTPPAEVQRGDLAKIAGVRPDYSEGAPMRVLIDFLATGARSYGANTALLRALDDFSLAAGQHSNRIEHERLYKALQDVLNLFPSKPWELSREQRERVELEQAKANRRITQMVLKYPALQSALDSYLNFEVDDTARLQERSRVESEIAEVDARLAPMNEQLEKATAMLLGIDPSWTKDKGISKAIVKAAEVKIDKVTAPVTSYFVPGFFNTEAEARKAANKYQEAHEDVVVGLVIATTGMGTLKHQIIAEPVHVIGPPTVNLGNSADYQTYSWSDVAGELHPVVEAEAGELEFESVLEGIEVSEDEALAKHKQNPEVLIPKQAKDDQTLLPALIREMGVTGAIKHTLAKLTSRNGRWAGVSVNKIVWGTLRLQTPMAIDLNDLTGSTIRIDPINFLDAIGLAGLASSTTPLNRKLEDMLSHEISHAATIKAVVGEYNANQNREAKAAKDKGKKYTKVALTKADVAKKFRSIYDLNMRHMLRLRKEGKPELFDAYSSWLRRTAIREAGPLAVNEDGTINSTTLPATREVLGAEWLAFILDAHMSHITEITDDAYNLVKHSARHVLTDLAKVLPFKIGDHMGRSLPPELRNIVSAAEQLIASTSVLSARVNRLKKIGPGASTIVGKNPMAEGTLARRVLEAVKAAHPEAYLTDESSPWPTRWDELFSGMIDRAARDAHELVERLEALNPDGKYLDGGGLIWVNGKRQLEVNAYEDWQTDGGVKVVYTEKGETWGSLASRYSQKESDLKKNNLHIERGKAIPIKSRLLLHPVKEGWKAKDRAERWLTNTQSAAGKAYKRDRDATASMVTSLAEMFVGKQDMTDMSKLMRKAFFAYEDGGANQTEDERFLTEGLIASEKDGVNNDTTSTAAAKHEVRSILREVWVPATRADGTVMDVTADDYIMLTMTLMRDMGVAKGKRSDTKVAGKTAQKINGQHNTMHSAWEEAWLARDAAEKELSTEKNEVDRQALIKTIRVANRRIAFLEAEYFDGRKPVRLKKEAGNRVTAADVAMPFKGTAAGPMIVALQQMLQASGFNEQTVYAGVYRTLTDMKAEVGTIRPQEIEETDFEYHEKGYPSGELDFLAYPEEPIGVEARKIIEFLTDLKERPSAATGEMQPTRSTGVPTGLEVEKHTQNPVEEEMLAVTNKLLSGDENTPALTETLNEVSLETFMARVKLFWGEIDKTLLTETREHNVRSGVQHALQRLLETKTNLSKGEEQHLKTWIKRVAQKNRDSMHDVGADLAAQAARNELLGAEDSEHFYEDRVRELQQKKFGHIVDEKYLIKIQQLIGVASDRAAAGVLDSIFENETMGGVPLDLVEVLLPKLAATDRTLSPTQLRRIITDSVEELEYQSHRDADWNSIDRGAWTESFLAQLEDHFTHPTELLPPEGDAEFGEPMPQPIIHSLTDKDLSQLDELIMRRWRELREAAFVEEISKSGMTRDLPRLTQSAGSILEARDLGNLHNGRSKVKVGETHHHVDVLNLWDAIAPSQGIAWTEDATAMAIQDIKNEIRDNDLKGVRAARLRYKQLNLITDSGTIKPMELMRDAWYAHALSGIRTHVDIFTGSIIHGFLSTALASAQLAMGRGKSTGDAVRIYGHWIRGLIEGAKGFSHLLKTGDISLLPDANERLMGQLAQEDFYGGETLEAYSRKLVKEGKKHSPQNYWAQMKFVRRMVFGLDYIGATAGRKAMILYGSSRRAWLAESKGVDGAENELNEAQVAHLQQSYELSKKLGYWDKGNKKVWEDALTQANDEIFKTEGTEKTKSDPHVQARAREITEEEINNDVIASSTELGRVFALNAEPVGMGGVLHRVLQKFGKFKYPLGFAFSRAAMNMGQNASNYAPFLGELNHFRTGPFAKEIAKKFGLETGKTAAFYTGEQVTPERRDLMRLQHMFGSALMLSLLVLFDDDDEPIDVVGSLRGGIVGSSKRRQLLAHGVKPYSIKIHGHYVSYKNTPLAAVLSALGNFRDAHKYKDEVNTEDALYTLFTGGLSYMVDVGPTSQATRLFGAIGAAGEKETAKRVLEQFLAGTLGTLASPNLLREMDTYPIIGDPKYYKPDSDQVMAHAWSQLVILPGLITPRKWGTRPMLNGLGEPVEIRRMPWSRWYKGKQDDPVWLALAKQSKEGVFLSISKEAQMVGVDGVPREMTMDEQYHYQREVGQRLRGRLEKRLEWFVEASPRQAQRYLDKSGRSIKKQVVREMNRAARYTPRFQTPRAQ